MTDQPREIDCRDVAERLYEYLDGELDARRAEEVRHHLEDCERCLKLEDFETAYVSFLEARTRTRGAPEQLKRRILDHILFGDSPPEP